MLAWLVIDRRHLRHSTPIVSSLRPQRLCVRFRLSPKSLPNNTFAGPHPLNLYATIFYKTVGVGYWIPGSPLVTHHSSQHSSPFLSHSCALFGTAQNSTRFFASASELFTPKHPGVGVSLHLSTSRRGAACASKLR